jgi:SAM-dependent methyltransferase
MRQHYAAAGARVYDRRWREFTARTLAPVVAVAAPYLKPGLLVLDAGCGTGTLLGMLRDREPGIALNGVDASAAMLAQARVKLGPDAHLRRADFDADWLPTDALGSYGLVTCANTLHYARDPARLVAQLAQLLAPGGALIIEDFTRHGWWWSGFEALLHMADAQHRHTLTVDDLLTCLSRARLRARDKRIYAAGGPWQATLLAGSAI